MTACTATNGTNTSHASSKASTHHSPSSTHEAPPRHTKYLRACVCGGVCASEGGRARKGLVGLVGREGP
jgi:hypothetical protein